MLRGLAESWQGRRADVEAQAEEMAGAMRHYLEERTVPGAAPPPGDAARRAAESLARRWDPTWGGFGDAPKFPTPSNLFLLLEGAGEWPQAAEMLAGTLDQMARGGMYDQLAGGFHRYATDREWKVPHFEKMLYDNGLLLEVYALEHERSGSPEAARIARETAELLAREMTAPEGAFWSAIDAETHGHEGAYYVWTRAELDAALGPEDAAFLAPLYGFDRPPFFEGTRYVLHLPRPLDEEAARRRMAREDLLAEVGPLKERLLAARSRRERPATDDKILADWNGTAIAGLATAGRVLGEPALVERAARAADFVLRAMRPAGGPLLHSWRAGQGKVAAMLGDYAFLVHGLLALHRAMESGAEGSRDRSRWLDAAVELTLEQIERLGDPQGGFFAAGESRDVLFRSKDIFDGAMPSGNAMAALNLLELAELTGDPRFRSEARATLQAFAPVVESHPDAVRMLALAARRYERALGERETEAAAVHEREPYGGMAKLEEREERAVTCRVELGEPGDDGFRRFRLTIEVEPGWHLNANPASESFLVPTEVRSEGAEVRNLRYPVGTERELAYGQRPLAVYEGSVDIEGEARPQGPGAALILTYQPCDDSKCLPPVERRVPVG